MDLWHWFTDPANWAGPFSIPQQLGVHLLYSFGALAAATLIALPLGVYIGHTGRGERFIVGSANAMRALPTFGVLILLVLVMAPSMNNRFAYVIPTLIVLVVLAVPPILAGVASGIRAIDPGVIDAARGLGYSPWQIIMRIELPCALPLTMSGVRSSLLQIVSTATVAAYVSLGGLGRFIIDGRATNDYTQMAGGSLLLVALALLLELSFVVLGRALVSPGLVRRPVRTAPLRPVAYSKGTP